MNLFGLVTGFLAGMVFYPWFGSLGLLVATAAGVLFDAAGRRPGSGADSRELVVPLYSLWGLLTRGERTEAQALFLRGIAGQLQLGGFAARSAFESFERARLAVDGRPWPEVVAAVTATARELDDMYLDRRSLLWIYAASRRLAALGTVRPGIAELLDVIARTFGIFDEVGSAGLGAQGDPYEKAWRNFKPRSSAPPEDYSVLGLSPDASVDEIKKAYRALVRRHHPDAQSGGHAGSETFLRVQQAYERIRRARNF